MAGEEGQGVVGGVFHEHVLKLVEDVENEG